MAFRRDRLLTRTGFRALLAIVVAVPGLGPPSGRALLAQALPLLNAPVSPSEAVRRIKLPAGFTVSLFASEPDVVQPIAMAIDHKGRLWVVENYSYPIWLAGPRGKDRS
jgi:hypothetical protein